MAKKYNDPLQKKIEAIALKDKIYKKTSLIDWNSFDEEQKIGFLMPGLNLFYEEAKARWKQAKAKVI